MSIRAFIISFLSLKRLQNGKRYLPEYFNQWTDEGMAGLMDVILCLLHFYRENKYCTAFWDNQIYCASYRLHTNQFCLVLTFCNTRSFISILNVLTENVGSILYVMCCLSGQYTILTLWYIHYYQNKCNNNIIFVMTYTRNPNRSVLHSYNQIQP